MSHRTQITLEDEQYERLMAEAERSGLGLAALVRRAVDVVYPDETRVAITLEAIDESFGAWDEAVDEDRAGHLADLRPGLGDRLADA